MREGKAMKTLLTTILLLLALTGCKIDLTIIGPSAVKTDSGSIDCATGTAETFSALPNDTFTTPKASARAKP